MIIFDPDQWLSALVWTRHGIVTVLRSFLQKKLNLEYKHFAEIYFRFCTAGDDRKLRYFVSDGRSSSSVTVLEGHSSYINDCVIEPVSGLDVASVSGKQ